MVNEIELLRSEMHHNNRKVDNIILDIGTRLSIIDEKFDNIMLLIDNLEIRINDFDDRMLDIEENEKDIFD